jgi:hypothetical protein
VIVCMRERELVHACMCYTVCVRVCVCVCVCARGHEEWVVEVSLLGRASCQLSGQGSELC